MDHVDTPYLAEWQYDWHKTNSQQGNKFVRAATNAMLLCGTQILRLEHVTGAFKFQLFLSPWRPVACQCCRGSGCFCMQCIVLPATCSTSKQPALPTVAGLPMHADSEKKHHHWLWRVWPTGKKIRLCLDLQTTLTSSNRVALLLTPSVQRLIYGVDWDWALPGITSFAPLAMAVSLWEQRLRLS